MNVLIADDEIDSLEEIKYCVEKYDQHYVCTACSNAFEALEQAEKTRFDIALLDIEMPVINGLELAERLIDLFPDIGIAFLTAYNNYASEAFEVNAVDYILKPIREERLFMALDKLEVRIPGKLGAEICKDRLSIRMFGKFTVWLDGELLRWNRQKSAEIFAYLVENKGCPVRKEILCELFWPGLETNRALVNLQTAMHSIRKTVNTSGVGLVRIEYTSNTYILQISEANIDAEQFESMLKKALELNDKSCLKQAVNLYTGDYLEEEGWLWAEPKKVMLRKKCLAALNRLRDNRR